VDRSSVFQVPQQYHHEWLFVVILSQLEFIVDGKNVEECLRWVFTYAVTGIQHRLFAHVHHLPDTTLHGMPQYRYIDVTFQTPQSVLEGFALFRRGGIALTIYVYVPPTKSQNGGLERT
jgi:hypothetical protein